MSENALKACMLALIGTTVIVLGILVGLGRDTQVTDALLAITGGVGALGVWERLKR